ncbi:HTH-type transcriptional regulator YidZ [Castellaniella defragrans]
MPLPLPTPLPDLKLLRLFDLLYELRSVTRVAEQMGQSQPTVSIWLRQLRDCLHDPLFIRTPGGMAPTPQADALIGSCRRSLEDAAKEQAPSSHAMDVWDRSGLVVEGVCGMTIFHSRLWMYLVPQVQNRIHYDRNDHQLRGSRSGGKT